MRTFTYYVGAHLVNELSIAGAVDEILHDGRDIIHVSLITGESLMIHLIDSSIPAYEVKHILRENTQNGHHTLFILWCDMLLPDSGTKTVLQDWHHALRDVYDGRIYAYKIYMQQLFIFPVYFDVQPYMEYHVARYGDNINVGALRCHIVNTTVDGLKGAWRVATFDGDPESYHRQRAEKIARPNNHSTLDRYFTLLGIEIGADRETVKRAYRVLARQYHPDLNADAQSHARMQELNIAYAMIIKAIDEAENRNGL
ncbi:MAG: DnaJ domain-containing protein [Anaerolineae bacterium]|nr:DnaJ domain-containing protein [Anaerolineae bacterium]